MANPGLSDEQAREAWRLYIEHGCSAKRAADALGISRKTLPCNCVLIGTRNRTSPPSLA